jgi:uncharacterized membrane protein
MTGIVKETHMRTTVKAVVYRLFSVLLAIAITLSYGATLAQALTFGAIALVWGLAWFYLFDRLALLISWHRDEQGKDTRTRSVVKSILYRIGALTFSAMLGRMMFLDSNLTAILMAFTQFLLNISVYFLLERIWNEVVWGKILPQTE